MSCPLAWEIAVPWEYFMIVPTDSLPLNGRAGTITSSSNCFFHQTMWLPNSGGSVDWNWWKLREMHGRKVERKQKGLGEDWVHVVQLHIPGVENSTYLVDAHWVSVGQMNTKTNVKGESSADFLVCPCHTLSSLGGGFQSANEPNNHCLWFLVNISDSQIFRLQILNLGSMCGLQDF